MKMFTRVITILVLMLCVLFFLGELAYADPDFSSEEYLAERAKERARDSQERKNELEKLEKELEELRKKSDNDINEFDLEEWKKLLELDKKRKNDEKMKWVEEQEKKIDDQRRKDRQERGKNQHAKDPLDPRRNDPVKPPSLELPDRKGFDDFMEWIGEQIFGL